MIGTKTGHRIGKNNDGDRNVILLQVQISDEDDIQTVQLYNPSGDDSIPINGSDIIIIVIEESWKIGIAADQLVTPDGVAGQKKIYSVDSNGNIKANLTLKTDGKHYFNGGDKSAVSHLELNSALQNLVTAINLAFATKLDGGGSSPALTLDISGSEVEEIQFP